MSVDLMNSIYVEKIECDKPQRDFYTVDNLILKYDNINALKYD